MTPSAVQPTPEPLPLDPTYATRDDIARAYNPVSAIERMLVTAAAQAWHRMQQAHQLERRLFAKTDPLELFSTNFKAFQSITRHVAGCERTWRSALRQLETTQRARLRQQTACPRPRPTPPDAAHNASQPANLQNEPKPAAAAAPTPHVSPVPPPTQNQLKPSSTPSAAPHTSKLQNEPDPARQIERNTMAR